MRIKTIQCKNLLSKSRLPEADYCINPYIGCLHGCIYCYSRFMKRFTNHTEKWGEFLDIKINATEVLEKELSRNPKKGTVVLSSVTDPYQPIEKKYRITRSILEILLKYNFPVSILTKSDLVIRDIDLLKQFDDCEVGLTITTLDEKIAKDFEPYSPTPQQRVNALETLHEEKIKTYGFIGPILPRLTELQPIFAILQGKVDFIMAESLNLKCGNWKDIRTVLERNYSNLLPIYSAGFDQRYWNKVGKELKKLSEDFRIPLKGFYRH